MQQMRVACASIESGCVTIAAYVTIAVWRQASRETHAGTLSEDPRHWQANLADAHYGRTGTRPTIYQPQITKRINQLPSPLSTNSSMPC